MRIRARERAGTFDVWFRITFGLTVTDDRYLDATPEDMVSAYWEDHYYRRRLEGKGDDAEEEVEDDDFEDVDPARLMELYPDDWFERLQSGNY